MLRLSQLLPDLGDSVKQGESNADHDLLLGDLDGLSVSLGPRASDVGLRESEELAEEVEVTLDVDVGVIDAGGDPVPQVGGPVLVNAALIKCTFLSSRFSGLLNKYD